MSENIVFVGSKPSMVYSLAIVQIFGTKRVKEVIVKARGRSISTAVDAVEISLNKFLKNIAEPIVKIGTETLESVEKKPIKISTIEITLKRECSNSVIGETHEQPRVDKRKNKTKKPSDRKTKNSDRTEDKKV